MERRGCEGKELACVSDPGCLEVVSDKRFCAFDRKNKPDSSLPEPREAGLVTGLLFCEGGVFGFCRRKLTPRDVLGGSKQLEEGGMGLRTLLVFIVCR